MYQCKMVLNKKIKKIKKIKGFNSIQSKRPTQHMNPRYIQISSMVFKFGNVACLKCANSEGGSMWFA